jgi:hypothetical protein
MRVIRDHRHSLRVISVLSARARRYALREAIFQVSCSSNTIACQMPPGR